MKWTMRGRVPFKSKERKKEKIVIYYEFFGLGFWGEVRLGWGFAALCVCVCVCEMAECTDTTSALKWGPNILRFMPFDP